jgi:alkylated DNA repair dioxygenase AlkB
MKTLLDHDGLVLYQEHYLEDKMEDILKDIVWRNDSITMFGKTHPQPRMTAWHGDKDLPYTYSKIKMISPGWTPALLKIKNKLEADLGAKFNSVLVNYYRDGKDHMSFHSDNEKELGINPVIASLSLGATRKFTLKHRSDKTIDPLILDLPSQSLLVMKGELQEHWVHKISKSAKVDGPRLNLTYRYIIN